MRHTLFITALGLGLLLCSCASKPSDAKNLQRDCVIQGSGPYFDCAPYPWYKYECERWQ